MEIEAPAAILFEPMETTFEEQRLEALAFTVALCSVSRKSELGGPLSASPASLQKSGT